MADANIRAVITAKDEASSVLSKFGDNVKKQSSEVALGVAAAGAATIAFGVSSIKAYEDSQNQLTQLNAVLKSTAGVAGVTSQAAIDLSKALQKTTKFSDEEVLSAENLLLTFTKIGKDIFPQATKTVLNMATALGEDTKSASIQLGKALQDPVLGVTALRRVGVNFSKDQVKVIKNLVETGQAAKAQQLILKELDTEFGGSAEAAGKTFAGQLAKLKNSFNDLQEQVGQTLIRALLPLAQWFGNWMDKVNKAGGLLDYFTGIVKRHKEEAVALAGAISGVLVFALVALTVHFAALALAMSPFIVAGAAIALIAFEIQSHWKTLIDFYQRDVLRIFRDLRQWFDDFTTFVKGTFKQTMSDLKQWWKDFKDDIGKATEFLKDHKKAIEHVADVLTVLFGPTLIRIGAQAVATGIQIAASAVVAGAQWVAQAVVAGAAWTVQFAIMVVKAIDTAITNGIQAVISGAIWVAQAIVASAAWVAQFIVVEAKAIWMAAVHAAQALVSSYAWVAQAAVASAAWIAQFIIMIAKAVWASGSHVAEAATSSAAWVASAATSSAAWSAAAGSMVAAIGTVTASVGGAIAALGGLNAALDYSTAKSALDKQKLSVLNAAKSADAQLRAQGKNKEADEAKAKFNADAGKLGMPGLAGGTNFATGGPTLVGERGPEIVNMPRGAQVIPNNQLGSGSTINVSVNAGAFMGTHMEARKFAQTILDHMKDIAGSKSMTLDNYIKM